MIKLSIVVPCYNEEENLPALFERFAKSIEKRQSQNQIEVVFVNNGSTDNSAQIFSKLLKDCSFGRLVEVPVNKGYGYGILQGLKECKGEYIGWTHADLQTDPDDVLKALDIINKDETVNLFIKGSRKGRSLFDNFFTVGMSIFESVYLGTFLYEINAQPNIFPKTFFDKWEEPPYDFALDLYAYYLAKKMNLTQIRFDVNFPPREHGESKWNTGLKAKFKFIKRTVKFSFELKKRGIK